MEYWGESPEAIAEVLGLSIPHVRQLISDLQQGGEPVEREFVVWVDNARGRILPHTALTGVAVKPNRNGPYTFGVEPPLTAQALTGMGLQAGLSWDLGLEGYVEVLEVAEIAADIRNPSLPHLLRLPDTQLVISIDETGTGSWRFAIAQHGMHEPELTAWAQTTYTQDLDELIDGSELRSSGAPAVRPSARQWQTLEPHPRQLREQVAEMAQAARERVVLCAPDLRHVPSWLEQTLEEAAERDIQIVLCPGKEGHTPAGWHFPHTTTPTSRPGGLSLIADEDHAVIHTDPDACLDRRAQPAQQGMYTSRDETAIQRLLEKLNLPRLRRRPSAPRLTAEAIAQMLRQELEKLRGELPPTVRVEVQPGDEEFAIQTLERHPPREKPTKAARKATAGIAWERILIERVAALAGKHQHLTITAERWKPPGVPLDLDVIVHDRKKSVVWILDAKNTKRADSQIQKMRDQIALLKHAPELTHGCPTIIGVIVHHRTQLTSTPQTTEHPDILRATLQGLGDLLLANRLPGQRPQPQTHTRKAA
jgi:hypothetical protein